MQKILIISLALFLVSAEAGTKRSYAAKAEFVRSNPCPNTSSKKGTCKGWVVDHKWPLCANGPDVPSNLQWSELKASKRKDVEELRLCRKLNRGEIQAGSDKADLCQVLLPSQWPLLTKALCDETVNEALSN